VFLRRCPAKSSSMPRSRRGAGHEQDAAFARDEPLAATLQVERLSRVVEVLQHHTRNHDLCLATRRHGLMFYLQLEGLQTLGDNQPARLSTVMR